MVGNLSCLLVSAISGGYVALIVIVCQLATIPVVYLLSKKVMDNKLKNAKKHADDIIDAGKKVVEEMKSEARQQQKEALIEARDEQHRLRNEFEKETKSLRADLQRQEQRLNFKEENLDKKERSIDKRLEQIELLKTQLEKKQNEILEKDAEISDAHNKMLQALENVAKLTKEEAKQELVDAMVEDAKKDAAVYIKEYDAKVKEDADKLAREIVSQAVQRVAVEQTSDITSTVIELPSDEMKGRLIGRSGRNIKAIENCTGVDVIIDDTPDVITLACFDPVRREIARKSIEKLMLDGRIHPSKIEETVNKMRNEIELTMKKAGENAVFDAGIYGMHPELVKLLGRMKYRTSYGQNMLDHALEVSYIAGILAVELGADVKVARRGGLLHDIGKAVDHEIEGTHVQIGVDLAKRYKESNAVIHCIEAHHNDVEIQTIEALIVQAADAISGARPGARRESLENYVKRLEKLEEIANSFAGVEQSYAIQAGREIRVAVKPEMISDEQAFFLAKDIARKLEEELEYPGQIKVNVLRELRCIEYAK